jgi:hypothetical protein
MTVVAAQMWSVQCDRCLGWNESGETGANWYYPSVEAAQEAVIDSGGMVAEDGRILCEECVSDGRRLDALRCTCPAGRGTNPGCPVCP